MTSFDEWQAAAKGERQPAEVCFDRQAITDLYLALERFADAKQAATGQLDVPARVTELAEEIKRLDAKVQAATKTLWFTKIPAHRWSDVEADHPATERQKAEDPKARLDDDGFEPAIVAATCVDPGLTVEQAVWLRDFLPRDRWDDVLTAVLAANKSGPSAPKGVSVIADRLISELRSITPQDEVSPSLSSEDG